MRANTIRLMVVWSLLAASCTPITPRPSDPRSPSEQAVVSTMERFFSALRTRDMATLDTLITPHATVDRMEQGRLVSQGSYLAALRQDSGASALLQHASVPLENFRMTSIDNAQIETRITTKVEIGTQTTNFRWHLIRAGPIWRIQRSEEMMWIDEEVGGEA